MGYADNTEQEFSPSDIIATVNGEPLFRSDLEARVEAMLAAYQAGGAEEDGEGELVRAIQTEVLDTMIGEALLRQGAELDGVDISEDELAAGYEQVLEEFENDKDRLLSALEDLGTTENDLLASIASRLKVQRYVETRAPLEDMEVTDEDVMSSYRNYTEGAESAPSFEDMAEGIREELERQRAQQAVFMIIEDLKKGSQIEVFIEL